MTILIYIRWRRLQRSSLHDLNYFSSSRGISSTMLHGRVR
jgi:hypothetical protein